MRWIRKHGLNVILVIIGMVGVCLLVYPMASDRWNSFRQSRTVESYLSQVINLTPNQYTEIIESALNYNQVLTESGMLWTMNEAQEAAYYEELNINDSGMMCYITIPKIDVMLPVYHGTDEEVLQVAVGHLPGSSLPVGGESSHIVLFGHRGLPSARLFTDLDELVEGDTFTLNVFGSILTYEVDQIRVVEPEDLRELQLKEGEDYCTLVTCTPYGINTHRLLVRGHRVKNAHDEVKVVAEALQIRPIYIVLFFVILIIIIYLLFKWIYGKKVK